jgi:hypothetical protein
VLDCKLEDLQHDKREYIIEEFFQVLMASHLPIFYSYAQVRLLGSW